MKNPRHFCRERNEPVVVVRVRVLPDDTVAVVSLDGSVRYENRMLDSYDPVFADCMRRGVDFTSSHGTIVWRRDP